MAHSHIAGVIWVFSPLLGAYVSGLAGHVHRFALNKHATKGVLPESYDQDLLDMLGRSKKAPGTSEPIGCVGFFPAWTRPPAPRPGTVGCGFRTFRVKFTRRMRFNFRHAAQFVDGTRDTLGGTLFACSHETAQAAKT